MPKVLVVDDEPQYGEFLRDWLTREGHEVKTAVTAEDAIDFGKHWQPNVLVADWMLSSHLDGLHVTEAVRAANPTLQAILITGYPSEELKARAEKARVFSFIEKPFSLSEIAGAVREAARCGRPPLAGHFLVISESATIGGLARDTLRADHYTAYVATTAAEALRVVREDQEVRFVILDGTVPGADWGLLAEELHAVRDELVVIGSSEGDDAEKLAAWGIERFLPRFWTSDDLHRLLHASIKACTECCLPLPLRLPLPGDAVGRWECAGCGARYQAVMAEDASDDVRRNVRAVHG